MKRIDIASRLGTVEPYRTRDGSMIRELVHPSIHGGANQSLAEATVPEGALTLLHRHHITEEIYHFTGGSGRMRLGDHWFEVGPGDSVLIPPGTPHQVSNTGNGDLVILCCCAPAYSHEDTELLDSGNAE